MSSPEPLRPVTDRLPFPDVLRGFALLGILPVNVAIFAFPLTWYAEPAPLTGGSLESAAYFLTKILFEQKFITLFSLLFGLGLGMQVSRVADRQGGWSGFVLRRLGVLFVFGFLHAALLFWGDVLATYAIIGLISLVAVRLIPRHAIRVGALMIALPFVLALLAVPAGFLFDSFLALMDPEAIASASPDYQPGMATGGVEDFIVGLSTGGSVFEIELVREASFLRLAAFRLVVWAALLMSTLMGYGWRIAGLFLIGIAIARDGRLLRPRDHPRFFLRLTTVGLLIGVPVQAALLIVALAGEGSLGWFAVGEALNYVGSLGLAAAYAGAVGLIVARTPSWLTSPLGAVGRTALSSYILQSLVFSALFTGWGLALYGQLDRATVWLIVLAFWVAQIVIANLWLAIASRGPLERLWRWLTYPRRSEDQA